MKRKIIFLKPLDTSEVSTEILAYNVLKNKKYDDCPYVNKEAIEEAFELYGTKLNPSNSNTYSAVLDAPPIEALFFDKNTPEIEKESKIIENRSCTPKILRENLDNDSEITDVCLST